MYIVSSRTRKGKPSSKEYYQVVDGRDTHHRKVGCVIGKHNAVNFPICIEFQDGSRSVYYAYQVRRVRATNK